MVSSSIVIMSETSSNTSEMSDQEHASLLDFVLEASDENHHFAASNVAEIMEHIVCPPHHHSTPPTYTDLSSTNYCNFDAGGTGESQHRFAGYLDNGSPPSTSHFVSYSAEGIAGSDHAGKHSGDSDWERTASNGYLDVTTGQWTAQYGFHPQQIDSMNNSNYSSSVTSIFTESTNQHLQSKEFHHKSTHQQIHVVQRRQNSSSSKTPKRRRVTTVPQRKAANVRERRRMFNLNEAFDILRKRVPAFSYEKRLSRIDTLRLAVVYIGFMEDFLNGKQIDEIKLRELESQFAELKAANALPSASRPKPKNSSSNGKSRNTKANRKQTENIK